MEGQILTGLLLNALFWVLCLMAATAIGIWIARKMFPDRPRRRGKSGRGERPRGNRVGAEEAGEGGAERPRKAA